MKYKHLLAAILFITTATWLWAEPSQKVVVQTPLSPLALTNSNDGEQSEPGAGEGGRISSPQKSEQTAPIWPPPRYMRKGMGLDLVIKPGYDLASTTFEVLVRTPGTLHGDPFKFVVILEDRPNKEFFTREMVRLGNNRYRFKGADLIDASDGARPMPQIKSSTRSVVSAVVSNPRRGRFSRGARVLTLQSQPVTLSFR